VWEICESGGNTALTLQLSWLRYLASSGKATEANSDVPTNPQVFYRGSGRGFLGWVVKANCLFPFWGSRIMHDQKACKNLAVPKLEIQRLLWTSRHFPHKNYLLYPASLSSLCGNFRNVRKQIGS